MEMKRIIPKQNVEYAEDAFRIAKICAANGISVYADDALQIWEDYSETMAAGWMTLPVDDEEVLQIVLMHSQEV